MHHIRAHINSLFGSVTYRMGDIIVDPGDDQDLDNVSAVLLTHAHFDHIYGLNALAERNPAVTVYTNAAGARALTDAKLNMSKYHDCPFVFDHPDRIKTVADGEMLNINGIEIQAIHTPGHHPSCITWRTDTAIFTGDAYIPGLKTVTNLPGGDKAAASASEALILAAAENRSVFPGHGEGTAEGK